MSPAEPLPRPKVLLALLAGVLALAAAGGAVFLVARPLLAPAPAVSGAAAVRAEVPDLAALAPQPREPAAVPSAALPSAGAGPAETAQVTAGPGITPTPPRVMVISHSTLTHQTKRDIAGLKHVEKIDSFDGGAVKVSGVGLNLLAVDPARFRAWAPEEVAGQQEVWNALLRGEFVADSTAVRRLGLALGSYYQVDGGPRLRVAASAPFGLPGVDGLVGRRRDAAWDCCPGRPCWCTARRGRRARSTPGCASCWARGRRWSRWASAARRAPRRRPGRAPRRGRGRRAG
nr:hypothetical protein GCM10020093_041770 [Planobispora longispora]